VVLPQGESEVKGDPQTPEKISSLLAPVITPAAKQHLQSGFAEWDFELEGRGQVRACAEVKVGLVNVSFFLDRCETLAKQADRQPPAPPRQAPTAPAMPRQAPPLQAPPPPMAVADRYKLPSDPSIPAMAKDIPIEELDEDELEIPRAPMRTQPPVASLAYDNALSDGSTAAIDKLLSKLLEVKGSDLHISTNAPPMMRVDGEMRIVQGYELQTAEQVQRTLMPIVPPRNREEFAKTHDTDFAYELAG
jgi:twitching motility protein PilT